MNNLKCKNKNATRFNIDFSKFLTDSKINWNSDFLVWFFVKKLRIRFNYFILKLLIKFLPLSINDVFL